MCTKTWRWFHVTMVFFVFIASLFLATIAAVSKKTHMTWKKEAATKEIQLAQLKREFQAMSRGDRSQLAVADESRADDIPDNMFDVRSKLSRVMMDRGRVWRGATVQDVTKNPDWQKVTIKLGTIENPNQIQGAGTVMYAFKEAHAPNEVEPVAGEPGLDEELPVDDPAAAAAARRPRVRRVRRGRGRARPGGGGANLCYCTCALLQCAECSASSCARRGAATRT